MEVGQTVIITKTGEYGVITGKPFHLSGDPFNSGYWYPVETREKSMYLPESSLSTKEQKVLNILRQWKSSK